jgi:hypothetical protein
MMLEKESPRRTRWSADLLCGAWVLLLPSLLLLLLLLVDVSCCRALCCGVLKPMRRLLVWNMFPSSTLPEQAAMELLMRHTSTVTLLPSTCLLIAACRPSRRACWLTLPRIWTGSTRGQLLNTDCNLRAKMWLCSNFSMTNSRESSAAAGGASCWQVPSTGWLAELRW